MPEIGSKVKKAITQPYKIPGYVKRRVDNILNSVEGTRIIWPQAGRAYLEDFGLRRPLGHEVLVKTHTTLVSAGTERAMFAKLPNTKVEYPYYPGYSGSGEVLMVGEQVTRFRPGDRVAGSFPHWSINLYEEDQLNLIPDGVTMAQASFYHVGVIALQGVRKARIELGERAAIIGPGLIGLIALQLTVAAGAYPVTVIGSSNRRLPLGLTYGAHAAINLAEGREALDEVQADVTIDITGSPEAIHDAIRCTRRGGRIVLLGSSRGVTRQIDFDRVREAGLTLVGAHIMSLPQREKLSGWWPLPAEGETLLQLMADGRLQVDQLLTDELSPTSPAWAPRTRAA
jgi:2-desacetyl-2-hydroxyethyl bacteriochlorophyllide A dehydrogenase